jgi:hypothetical protein
MTYAKSGAIATGKNVVAGDEQHENIENSFPLAVRSDCHCIQDESFFYFRLTQLLFSGLGVEILSSVEIVADETCVEDQFFLCFDVSTELILVRLQHIHTKESRLFTVDELVVLRFLRQLLFAGKWYRFE